MQKKTKNEYDVTRNMLKTIRTLTESKISKNSINEQSEIAGDSLHTLPSDVASKNLESGIEVINDVDVKLLSDDKNDMKLTDEQKKSISSIIDSFKTQVTQIAEFEPGFTISPDQVRLDGKISEEDISFVFIAGREDGVYINADMLKLEQNVASTLEKLAKFQLGFHQAMEPVIDQRRNNIMK
jgi:hypothetical protein